MTRGSSFEALKTEISEKARPIVFWTGAGLSAPSIPGWAALRDILLAALKEKAKDLDLTSAHRLSADYAQIKGR